MKILFIHQHFVTTAGVGATRSHDICRYLAERGHQVTVVCGYAATRGLPPVGRFHLWRTHVMDGFKVIICNATYVQTMTGPRRMLAFLWFAFIATLAGLRERGLNLVFATSTPLTVVIPGVIVSKLKRKPYVFEARDLWPEDNVAAGTIKEGSLLHRFLLFLERVSYREARQITVVSEGFYKRLLERGIPKNKLNLIPLGADGEKFAQAVANDRPFREKGLEGKKIAIYTGTHGYTNGLFQLIDAAELLKQREDIAIVLFGKGSKKPELIEDAKRRGLSNVHFFDPIPIGELVNVMAACHMGLIVFRQISRPRWLTPNKFYDYCFSALPSIVNFAGTTAEIVQREKIGLACEPGSAQALADAIIHYADNEAERKETGERAKAFCWENYDRKNISGAVDELFSKSLVDNRLSGS